MRHQTKIAPVVALLTGFFISNNQIAAGTKEGYLTYICVKTTGGKPAILHISDDYLELAKDPNRGTSFAKGSGMLEWSQKSDQSGYWSTFRTWDSDLVNATKANVFGYSSYLWHPERQHLIYAWGTLGVKYGALFGITDQFTYLYECTPFDDQSGF